MSAINAQICFLCDSKSSKSYHRFPKNPLLRSQWMKICQLQEGEDVNKLRICGNHFSKSDMYSVYSGRILLTTGALPSPNVECSYLLPRYDVLQGNQSVPVVSKELSNQEEKIYRSSGEIHNDDFNAYEEEPKEDNKNLTREQSDGSILKETTNAHRSKRNYEDVNSESEPCQKKQKAYNIQKMRKLIDTQKVKIRVLQQKNRRLTKKIENLKQLLGHLKSRNLISTGAYDHLMDNVPENCKFLFERSNGRRNIKYSPELRQFAVTLQFYSTRAYNYVRKTFGKLLPHTSTIRKWYSVIEGNPGFSAEALKSLRSKNENSQVLLNIVMDEMSIRSQMIYNNGEFHGGVDLGTGFKNESDCVQQATSALVFMAVAVNSSWKLPIGYCFINGLDAPERANLLLKCLELIHQTGCIVTSITFDGTRVNLKMCEELGAKFDYYKEFQPFFLNPFTNEKVYIFWDPCHMLKLVRNTIGDKGILLDDQKKVIKWSYFQALNSLQNEQGLHLANKLTNQHIKFGNRRMNVRLAAQTLSESVFNSFRILSHHNYQGFEDVAATAEFCFQFNHIFDLMNCRNRFSKKNKFNIPLDAESESFFQENAIKFEKYIVGLQDEFGTPILKTKRFTGFLGFIICLRNILELYKTFKSRGLNYLLTFKLTQDPLEMFFSAVRSRGGFNNNPNVIQFKSAFKRLLIKNELKFFYGNSNCMNDYLDILSVSSGHVFSSDTVSDETIIIEVIEDDNDYIQAMWSHDLFVEGVVQYMSGYVVSKITKKSICRVCRAHLLGTSSPVLIKIKDRGDKLLIPSEDVQKLCLMTEKKIRQYKDIIERKNVKMIIMTSVLKDSFQIFNTVEMTEHIKSQDLLDNHRVQLIKLIVEYFIEIRFHHEANLKNLKKNEFIRQKFTKLILFRNQ